MNILQDIMGLITKRKIKLPTDKDYLVVASYTDAQEMLKPQPKMQANLINLAALKKYVEQTPTSATYKSYVAIISQSATNAPAVDTLLENTIGAPVTYEYNGVGDYSIKTTSNKFTSGKTVIMVSPGRKTSDNVFLGTTIAGEETIGLFSYNRSGVSANGLMALVTVEIRVYN